MDNAIYRFRLGDFDGVAAADGSKDYPLKSFFANVPLAQVEEALRQRGHPVDVITTPYTNLLIDTGQHRVLIDMGAGSLSPTTGRLADNLRRLVSASGVGLSAAAGVRFIGVLDTTIRSTFAILMITVKEPPNCDPDG